MHTRKEQCAGIIMITDRRVFLEMRTKGKKWVSKGLILQAKDRDSSEGVRTGFTVSKKVDKSAVMRNRIKRRLRAVAADVLSAYAQDGCDYVLIGRKESATRPYHMMRDDLKWCLKKTGYYHRTERTGDL